MKIPVETSARHVHLKKEDLETLFGSGYELTKKKDLSQPGQFSCEERVEVRGTKKSLPTVSILGPLRAETQVEISLTDARSIGVDAPVRESGDIEGSGSCIIAGPKGEIKIEKGVIAAKRHIHATPEEAASLGISDREIVSVRMKSKERPLIFDEVVVRVREDFALALHIDTDESSAAGVDRDTEAEIVKC